MKQVAKTGKVLAIHAENAPITDKLGAVAYQNGETTLAAYVATRPVFTEVEAIQKPFYLPKKQVVGFIFAMWLVKKAWKKF